MVIKIGGFIMSKTNYTHQNEIIIKKTSRSKIISRLIRDRYIYLMILPVIIYFIIFAYWPMTWLRMAFYDFKMLGGFARSKFVGMDNFIKFFFEMDAWRLIWNTVAINLLALAFVFPAPILLALLLNEVQLSKLKRTIQTISYLPHFISTVVLVGMITSFLSPSVGIFSQIMSFMGLEPIYFLGNPKYFRTILVVSGIWQGCGWGSIVYLASLSGIDSQLYEAAKIDGASRFRLVWHITLPGIMPTIIIMLILQIGQILSSNFEKMFLLQNSYNTSISEVLATYVYKRAMQQGDYSLATAAGLFNSCVALVFVSISNWLSKKYTETSLW
jgi:putative aldouronate transport system permease protein